MKLFCLSITYLMLASILDVSHGQTSPSSKGDDYITTTNWLGTKFKICMIKRLNAENVIMAVRVITDDTAPNATFLGIWPGGEVKSTGPVTPKNMKEDRHPNPFSLMPSVLFDQASKISYSAIPEAVVTSGKFYGPCEIITTMHPGSWLQLSVQFRLPVPPPDPDGKIPVQKVDVTLPQATAPIKGVVVPAL